MDCITLILRHSILLIALVFVHFHSSPPVSNKSHKPFWHLNLVHILGIVFGCSTIIVLFSNVLQFEQLYLQKLDLRNILIPQFFNLLNFIFEVFVFLLLVNFVEDHGFAQNLMVLVFS